MFPLTLQMHAKHFAFDILSSTVTSSPSTSQVCRVPGQDKIENNEVLASLNFKSASRVQVYRYYI